MKTAYGIILALIILLASCKGSKSASPAWVVSTLAGSGTAAHQNGAAADARFDYPTGVAVDKSGNVYVADYNNHRIRKITPGGEVSDFAGSGATGSGTTGGYQDGAATTVARFKNPAGVAVDESGNVYVADQKNHRIRKIAKEGGTWTVDTIAGDGTPGDQDDTATTTARFNWPVDVAVDKSGNVYVADQKNHRIRKIIETEKVDADGNKTKIWKVSTLAGSSTAGRQNGAAASARFKNPAGVAVDKSGDVYVADYGNYRIRKIEITPGEGQEEDTVEVSDFAGDGTSGDGNGTAAAAQFHSPHGVAVDSSGNVYVADHRNNRIQKITDRRRRW